MNTTSPYQINYLNTALQGGASGKARGAGTAMLQQYAKQNGMCGPGTAAPATQQLGQQAAQTAATAQATNAATTTANAAAASGGAGGLLSSL